MEVQFHFIASAGSPAPAIFPNDHTRGGIVMVIKIFFSLVNTYPRCRHLGITEL